MSKFKLKCISAKSKDGSNRSKRSTHHKERQVEQGISNSQTPSPSVGRENPVGNSSSVQTNSFGSEAVEQSIRIDQNPFIDGGAKFYSSTFIRNCYPHNAGGDRRDDRKIFYGTTPALEKTLPQLCGHVRFIDEMEDVPRWNPTTQPAVELDLHSPPMYAKGNQWTDHPSKSWLRRAKHRLPPDVLEYLVNVKKVHWQPPIKYLKTLTIAFFSQVFPHCPVYDRLAGWYDFIVEETSPLSIHSCMFNAVFYVNDKLLLDCGFPNRHAARSYFYERAKLLYSFDVEPRQIHVIQVLILLSHWHHEPGEEKQTRHWIQTAMSLAIQMGMHRSLRDSLVLSKDEKRLWRRVWWTLYVWFDVFNSIYLPSSVMTECPLLQLDVLSLYPRMI